MRTRGIAAVVGAVVTGLVVTLTTSCGLVKRHGDAVVLTTFTVLADITRAVAGPHLKVESLTKPGAEIHGYEPTPGDIKRAAKADLIIDNGMNLEAWFGRFVAGLDVRHVVASQGVTPIPIASDAYAGKPNPHAWMSPQNVIIYVRNIVTALSELAPAHAAQFRANGDHYSNQLRDIAHRLVTRLRALPPNERALVTCEGAFSYLARDSGLTEKYLWPVNAEQQSTPKQIVSAIDFVKENHVPAVFCESTVSDKSMRRVAEATGARFGGVLYVDSLSASDGPVPTYLALLNHDINTIVGGLTGEKL